MSIDDEDLEYASPSKLAALMFKYEKDIEALKKIYSVAFESQNKDEIAFDLYKEMEKRYGLEPKDYYPIIFLNEDISHFSVKYLSNLITSYSDNVYFLNIVYKELLNRGDCDSRDYYDIIDLQNEIAAMYYDMDIEHDEYLSLPKPKFKKLDLFSFASTPVKSVPPGILDVDHDNDSQCKDFDSSEFDPSTIIWV